MGYGEDYIVRFGGWLDTLSPEERTEYRALFPKPVTWKGWWDNEDRSEVLGAIPAEERTPELDSELAKALMEYLDCECTYFPSMRDDAPIMAAYSYARRDSVREGFVPVLITADDETLWECLIMNSDPDSDGADDDAFDPDKAAGSR